MPISKELQDEIDAKQRELDTLHARAAEEIRKSKEVVIGQIKELMKENKVSFEDLGGKSAERKTVAVDKNARVPKYKLGEKTWSGRGPHPKWIKAYVAENGKDSLNNLLLNKQ